MTTTPLFNNPRINVLLLIDITIIVYLTVFVSGFSTLDDTAMMAALQKGELTFYSFALAGGYTYLRPLTMLTYLIDFHLWGDNSAAFHLTNLVIHLANACLIYNLCRTYLQKTETREGISLFAALFFAISPLNSESVLWVSGRTDLLCCFFFLAALTILVTDKLTPFFASGAFFTLYFCSLLAKESSIVLLGIVPLYLLFTEDDKSIQTKIGLCSAAAIASSIYLFMRLGPKGQLDSGATKIVSKVITQSIPDLFYKSMAAAGFYIKKLLWPYPLNLAIQSINEPLYFIVGIITVIAVSAIFLRYKATRLPLLIIVLGLVPPLLAFLGNIPWTMYAERYLYLPMTGFTLLLGLLLLNSHRMPQWLPFLLIIPLALSTIHRSGQWAEPVTLWHDTVLLSPQFPQAHVVYAYELIQAGRLTEAEKVISSVRGMKFENELLLKCVSTINHK